MATDALTAYRRDTQAGKDSLLVCDTKEMADALNRRLHRETIDADAPTVTAARGHRIAVGDLIISRRNDPTIGILQATEKSQRADPVRNGNRWRVYAVDPDNQRIAARRLTDGARTVFTGDYLREQITHGYAITVHSAQGVTADTTHAVLSENTSRAVLYVAMSRGREANTVFLVQRLDRDEHGNPRPRADRDCRSVLTSRHAADFARSIIANDGNQPRTAHDITHDAGESPSIPERLSALSSRMQRQAARRRGLYLEWQRAQCGTAPQLQRDVSRGRHTELSLRVGR